MSETEHRERCYRCLRPLQMCYCRGLPRVETDTRIVVLQHPHERTHPFGTARLVKLCMPNAELHVPIPGFTGTLEHRVDVPENSAVLFPHPDAPDLAELPATDHPQCLIVLDGTWSHAKRVYRENGWLHGLPHVRLDPKQPSRYRIRKEPRTDYISTLEAIVEALRVIEPDTRGLDDLLTAFDRMIDRQIDHTSSNKRVARFRRRPRPRNPRTGSPLLADPALVVAYAEAPLAATQPQCARRLVQWVAARVDTGQSFEAFIRPDDEPPLPVHLQHMRVGSQQVQNGMSLAAAATAFREWLERRSSPAIAAWTGSTLAWGSELLPADSRRTELKTLYCNTAQRRAGFLEQVVEREGLEPVANTCTGRAGDRLANVLAIARWLQQRATMQLK